MGDPTPHQPTEQLLRSLDIEPELTSIPLAVIDWDRSKQRQTRDQFLDDDLVERYVAALDDGATFPPLIVETPGDGAVVLLGGVHRAAALTKARGDQAQVPAYDVGPVTDETARLISIGDNASHGMPLSDRERARHAVALVNTGMSQADAARRCGLSSGSVSRRITAEKFKRRAKRSGYFLKDTGYIPVTGQAYLGSALELMADATLVEAIMVAQATKAGVAGCRDLAARIEAANGDDILAVEYIHDYANEHRRAPKTSKRPGPASAAHQIREAARSFLSVDPDEALNAIADRDRETTLELISRLGARAERYARALAVPR